MVVGGSQQGVKKSLSTQRELLEPDQKLPGCGLVGEHAQDIPRRPSLLGKLTGRCLVQRLGKAAGIGHDMNEFSQYLRRDVCFRFSTLY